MLQDIQNGNAKKVVQCIREKGPMSRVELSEAMGIPQPTMTRIIEKLIDGNILVEKGFGTSNGGRRPILVAFNENCSYAAGVELGRNAIRAAVTNLDGKILSFREKETALDLSIDQLIMEVGKLVSQVVADSGVDSQLIFGVGVGLPGPLNESPDGRISPPNFYGAEGIPLKERLEEVLEYEVTIENDANCGALAEKWFGAGKNVENFIFLFADVGIGSGIILRNGIYRGTYGEAGEIGHSTIHVFGERCYCGNYGCLETFCSLPVIINKVQNELKTAPERERLLFPEESMKIQDIVSALKRGSFTAEKVLREAGQFLGIGASNLVNLFAPDEIIIGGKAGASHPIFMESVRESLRSHVIGYNGKKTPVSVSDLSHGVVLGAAARAIHETFYSLSK
nr:ROK family transcriptional regulator [Metabacillus kandeliae]